MFYSHMQIFRNCHIFRGFIIFVFIYEYDVGLHTADEAKIYFIQFILFL